MELQVFETKVHIMKVWFWIKEFQVFEIEVHTMINLIGRRKKIWVKISSGKDFYGILIFL